MGSSAKSAHSNSSSSALSASPKDQPRFNCSVGSMQLATVHLFALRMQFRAEAVEILHRLLTAAGTEGRCSRRANMSDFRYKSMVSAPRAARHRHYSARQPFATVRSTEDRRPDLDPRATSRAVLVDVLQGPQTVFRTSSRAKTTGLFLPRDPFQWLLVSGLVQFELWGECKHAKGTANLGEVNHKVVPHKKSAHSPLPAT